MTTKTVAKKTTTKKETTTKTETSTKKSTKKIAVPAFFPKYPEYRLSDVISTIEYREVAIGHVKRLQGYVREGDTLKEYIFRMFPNSIASQYLRKTKRINDVDVLSNIIDDFMKIHNIDIPADDVMVMHLRVGDVIDRTEMPVEDFLNQRVDSFRALYPKHPEPPDFSPVYVRCLASFDRALKKTKELGFHKISLVYGFHIRQPIEKSKEYLAALAKHAQSQGFEVEMVTHTDADVSFAYACKAKHFIPGGGGFSKLMAKMVRAHGHDVYQVRV
jgi:hypothetical protein